MKINLLKETVRELAVNGVSSEDVLYVFNNLGYCSWVDKGY